MMNTLLLIDIKKEGNYVNNKIEYIKKIIHLI